MLNPEIVAREGAAVMREGCMSVPDYTGDVERATDITVRFLDGDGNPREIDDKRVRGGGDPARDGPPGRHPLPRPHLFPEDRAVPAQELPMILYPVVPSLPYTLSCGLALYPRKGFFTYVKKALPSRMNPNRCYLVDAH